MTSGRPTSPFRPIASAAPICYAHHMVTHLRATVAASSDTETTRPPRQRGWRFWLLPQPFNLVTSWFYLQMLLIWLDAGLQGRWTAWDLRLVARDAGWRLPAAIAGVVLLLIVDRAGFWLWGHDAPRQARLAFTLARIALVGLTAVAVSSFGQAWLPVYLFLAVPYVAAFQLAPTAAYALAATAWIAGIVKVLAEVELLHHSWAATDIGWGIILFSLATALVLIMARFASDEIRRRVEVEDRVAELAAAHRRLAALAHQALAATEERHQLADRIHADLLRWLTA